MFGFDFMKGMAYTYHLKEIRGNMEQSGDTLKKTETLKSLENRCGSCTKFVMDFNEGERRIRGHCGVRPRKGSINQIDYICDVYEMMPELKQRLIEQTPEEKDNPTIAREERSSVIFITSSNSCSPTLPLASIG